MKTWLTVIALLLAVMATFVPGMMVPLMGLLLAVLVITVRDPLVLKAGLRVGLILAFVFSAAIAGGAVAWASGIERGIQVAGNLLIRFGVLWLTTGALARGVSTEHLILWAQKFGMAQMGLVAGLALNVLPVLISRCGDVFKCQRLRYGKRWYKGWGEMVEVLLAHTARLADGAAAAATLRGHRCLVEATPNEAIPTAPVIVVTGKPGTGKTTSILEALETLKSEGFKIRGLVQPGIFSDGEKTGFLIRDLATGDETGFAVRTPLGEGQHGTRFTFTEEGATLARTALSRDVKNSILIVDELGPVELRGGGHLSWVLGCLVEPKLKCAVLVVRRHLVPALLDTLSAREATIYDIESSPEKMGELSTVIRDAACI